eukprot:598756-Amorphochlora_amoeboformis.AAC.1
MFNTSDLQGSFQTVTSRNVTPCHIILSTLLSQGSFEYQVKLSPVISSDLQRSPAISSDLQRMLECFYRVTWEGLGAGELRICSPFVYHEYHPKTYLGGPSAKQK